MTTKSTMPADLKAKWLQALRSGEYKQGYRKLFDAETGGFCCLGVLQHVLDGKVETDEAGASRGLPSCERAKSKGLSTPVSSMRKHGWCPIVPFKDGELQLSAINDIRQYDGSSNNFLTIANLIEEHVEGI
jgi:hypothetical protein